MVSLYFYHGQLLQGSAHRQMKITLCTGGVLRVLQHSPTQLNNISQHKQLTTLVALVQQNSKVMVVIYQLIGNAVHALNYTADKVYIWSMHATLD